MLLAYNFSLQVTLHKTGSSSSKLTALKTKHVAFKEIILSNTSYHRQRELRLERCYYEKVAYKKEVLDCSKS